MGLSSCPLLIKCCSRARSNFTDFDPPVEDPLESAELEPKLDCAVATPVPTGMMRAVDRVAAMIFRDIFCISRAYDKDGVLVTITLYEYVCLPYFRGRINDLISIHGVKASVFNLKEKFCFRRYPLAKQSPLWICY